MCNDKESQTLNLRGFPVHQNCYTMHSFPDLNEYIYIYIYINNFIHNVLIKTINNDTSKQYVETTVLVHAFTALGNTLINSQPSCQEVLRFVLQLHQ